MLENPEIIKKDLSIELSHNGTLYQLNLIKIPYNAKKEDAKDLYQAIRYVVGKKNLEMPAVNLLKDKISPENITKFSITDKIGKYKSHGKHNEIKKMDIIKIINGDIEGHYIVSDVSKNAAQGKDIDLLDSLRETENILEILEEIPIKGDINIKLSDSGNLKELNLFRLNYNVKNKDANSLYQTIKYVLFRKGLNILTDEDLNEKIENGNISRFSITSKIGEYAKIRRDDKIERFGIIEIINGNSKGYYMIANIGLNGNGSYKINNEVDKVNDEVVKILNVESEEQIQENIKTDFDKKSEPHLIKKYKDNSVLFLNDFATNKISNADISKLGKSYEGTFKSLKLIFSRWNLGRFGDVLLAFIKENQNNEKINLFEFFYSKSIDNITMLELGLGDISEQNTNGKKLTIMIMKDFMRYIKNKHKDIDIDAFRKYIDEYSKGRGNNLLGQIMGYNKQEKIKYFWEIIKPNISNK